MPDKNGRPVVLSTRVLEDEFLQKLDDAGISVKQHDFIQVSHEFDKTTFREYLNNPDSQARIFTSKNAVFSLEKLLASETIEIQQKKNFTVGIRATEMLQELGVETNARAGNAISLAQIIARNKGVQSVDFFCGNKALDDLPEYLESKGIRVHKEIVYKTELVSQRLNTADVDAMIFLSPTAVYSFFKENNLNPKIPCFCIGATTSEAIHFRCNNPRIPSNEPNLESVIDKVIEHFGIQKFEDSKI
ncbi:uroporphyrinogen-III synthase [Owenweeksia hongkongensis]|uniref:Uroporphyrinogen-III synthase n=1 Tax=Owenweeksia hongkongensis (strain DSM 17368 / CIP 108786 / JCM 12287 / NRRL B-23963 / UST20020801) TaxID=926562 RepID=G8R8U7_OWEHD|nr:uroporphyrinogen-III synthase [Owenweeksia hongkongensis]AEV32527.1 uroporphyrinogen-III synthase [Owenweeksia hongkongensis DSM 17368]